MTTLRELARTPALVDEIATTLPISAASHQQARRYATRAEIEHPINRAPSTIAASAVYLVNLLNNDRYSQGEVATAADVSTVAIRECYPEIGRAEGYTVRQNSGTNPVPMEGKR
ncbi:MAG: hypothetical protein ACOCV2_15040 [Persicimonas sp.]